MPDPRDEENEADTVHIDGAELRRCKACGCPLIIIPGPNGTRVPLDARSELHIYTIGKDLMGHGTAVPAGGHYVSHFRTCPKASEFSRSKKR